MKRIFTFLLLIAFCSKGFGQMHHTVTEKLINELESIHSRGHINGFSVAIVDQDTILFTKGFGYSDIKKGVEYTKNTIQTVGSISKTLIGIALLKAQELGKLDLNDPINKYLPYKIKNPYFPDKQITIRHLATHTSSIKDPSRYEKNGYVLKEKNNGHSKVNSNFRSPEEMMSKHSFLQKILDTKGAWYKKRNFLKKEPGVLYEYSNIAAGLAAVVLENAVHESFDTFTQKHMLTPLGMSQSGWSFDQVNPKDHSVLYATKETELAPYRLLNYPDGGFITSSSDLGKYLSELIAGYKGDGTILSKESYQELFQAQLADNNFEERNETKYNDEYNMGIFMGISAKGQIGHTGGDPGVAAFMFFNSKSGIGKLLIVNTELEKDGVKEFIDIWKVLEEYEHKLE